MEEFKIDSVVIAAPSTYKPVFETKSTDDSDRDQKLVMHNTPIGTIAGYDMTWELLTWKEISTILNAIMNKKQFSFHHKDPTIPNQWVDKTFYASNMDMAAQTLEDDEEMWEDLSINVRRIDPI